MELVLHRKWKLPEYSIGRLYIDGVFFCNTMEDTDRKLDQNMPLEEIRKIKVKGKTAIPLGRYEVDMDTVSPRFSKQKRYMDICEGKLPRLKKVPSFLGVLIHIGNYSTDTEGCVLVGHNEEKGAVVRSTETFKGLYAKLKEAHDKGEKIWITIK